MKVERKVPMSSRGFTLVELVTTISLMAILGIVVVVPLVEVTRAQRRQEARFELLDQGSIAVRRFLAEVRAVRRLGSLVPEVDTAEQQALEFGDVHYRLSGTTLQRSEDDGDTWKTVATQVSRLEFQYFDVEAAELTAPLDADLRGTVRRIGIELDLTRDGETLNLLSSAYLKNFAFKDE